ncbi:hypothetical protein [Arthrobacter sp. SAFR-044]|uniref:hypothetical protein n=1 Tax=Arthrobacter sp. SAFR-044 TaxID=3387278 RepID=UPI003F7CC579
MSSDPHKAGPVNAKPLSADPTGQDPAAKDPAAEAKLRLQLAIFDVTNNAKGKSLHEILESLRSAFATQGVETPPATWLESVASSAYYGEPYIIDLPAAIAADDAVSAPNKNVRDRLASRRKLRQKKLPAGTFPSPTDWDVPANEISHTGAPGHVHPVTVSRTRRGTRPILAAAGVAAAVIAAIVAVRGAGRRPVPLPLQPRNAITRKGSHV